MKQKILYTISILLMAALFLAGCKKDLSLKSKKLAVDSTKTGDTTVITLAYGHYDYLTGDASGNVYGLRFNFYADTIYKLDKTTGAKILFYTSPVTMDHDTVVTKTLRCLATDSLGNLYTLCMSGAQLTTDVIKISPTGSGSTLFENIEGPGPYSGSTIAKIAIDKNANFYFIDPNGLHKITPAGSSSVIAADANAFSIANSDGSIFYATGNWTGQVSIVQLNSSGAKYVIAGAGRINNIDAVQSFGIINDMGNDSAGNIYTSEYNADNNIVTIHKLNGNAIETTIISGAIGHVDGPISTAKIGLPFNLSTDAAGNLYFSEPDSPVSDVRKITF